MPHNGRCIEISCSFVHPSRQVTRTYNTSRYIYSYEQDDQFTFIRILRHAKRKYASENMIRHMWIGAINTNQRMRFHIHADTELSEQHEIVP